MNKQRLYELFLTAFFFLTTWPAYSAIDLTTAQKLLAEDRAADDNFGYSVSVSGDTAVIGAGGDDSNTGSAYVFIRSGGTWSQQAKLVAEDRATGDGFGISVSVSGNTAVIGAYLDDSIIGSAYVFIRSEEVWNQQAKLVAEDGAENDQFGYSVSVSGDTAVIGAYWDDGFTGSAYVFTRSGEAWNQQAKLIAEDGAADDYFGYSVSVDGDTAVIGAGNPTGSAYVFIHSDEIWSQQAKLVAEDGVVWDQFGYSVSVSGDTAVIGAYGDDALTGSAYVFIRSGKAWNQQAKLIAEDRAESDEFGTSVSVSGDTAMIGASGDDSATGSAYVFIRSGEVWSQQAKLVAEDGAEGDKFGVAVSVFGNTTMIGAHNDDSATGSAYVYGLSGTITVDSGEICTLAHAITAANTDTPSGGCPAGSEHDTITLETDVSLAAALPQIASPITIEGQGHIIDGKQGNWSVLTVISGGELSLNEVTITGGTAEFGGGIRNDGTLTLINSTVSGNTATNTGGGIYNNGTVTLTNSTISGNSAGTDGGGILNSGGIVTLTNSTVSGNTADSSGGGINTSRGIDNNGTVTLTNSTVSGNSAVTNGGGIANSFSTVTLVNSMVSGNSSADDGREIYNFGIPSVSIINADSFNLFGHSGENSTQAFYGFTPASKDVNASSNGTGGILKPTALSAILNATLADNGGPTKTHALVSGSPAVDLDTTCGTRLTTDQRGSSRPVGAGCDVGAFEDGDGNSNSKAFLPAVYFLLLLGK